MKVYMGTKAGKNATILHLPAIMEFSGSNKNSDQTFYIIQIYKYV